MGLIRFQFSERLGQEYKISCLGFRKSLIADRNMTIYPEKKSGLRGKMRKKSRESWTI